MLSGVVLDAPGTSNGEKATLAEKKATEWPPVSEETDDVAVIVDTKRRSQDSPLDADAGEPCGRQQKPIVAAGVAKMSDDLLPVVNSESIGEECTREIDRGDRAEIGRAS